ncbi:hypothetical protein [Rhodococcus sp. H29-C3]|uniref:hypothetical protein n=1 Tax=Rhodococcus sp. H29-C3 TaxID=3046307 RepID=UPI0024BBEAA1|nr:hypothetical protein [Rhodococcus sp. H29-C3]MDJ0359160.1 hypothetical protein [Rhodococcus sp. H29-C3]
MTDDRRETFDARDGGIAIEQPLLRAVLSYTPNGRPAPHPSEWVTLHSEDGAAAVRLRMACATGIDNAISGPFDSVFYPFGSFDIIVPSRNPGQGALLMIQLTGPDAPTRFEFDVELPAYWALRVEVDGSVTALDEMGRGMIYLGAPWAFDAESCRVPVRYTLENGKLVKNIELDAVTAFPVLVDPDPDAILTGDGRLITETWIPWLAPGSDDVTLPDTKMPPNHCDL